jgi:N utilization substance protein B
MASYRHLARIAVMQTLFSYEFRNEKIEPDLESNCREFADKLQDFSFAHEILDGVLRHKEEIRKIITKEAPEWPFERIALADRVILEMGVFEILFSKDVPPVVAINEAIEISKVFGDLNSSKFINGVLSTIMNKYQKGNPPQDGLAAPAKTAGKAVVSSGGKKVKTSKSKKNAG